MKAWDDRSCEATWYWSDATVGGPDWLGSREGREAIWRTDTAAEGTT